MAITTQMGKRNFLKRDIVLVFLSALLIVVMATNVSFADSITYPLNNSILSTNHIYNISIDINSISSALSSDTINLYVNNSLVYSNTYSSNGIYKIPMAFYNYGHYNISLVSSANKEINIVYTIPKPYFTAYSFYLNYYTDVIIIFAIGVILYVLLYFFVKEIKLPRYLILIFTTIAVIIYLLSNPLSANVILYYITLSAFVILLFTSVVKLLIDII